MNTLLVIGHELYGVAFVEAASSREAFSQVRLVSHEDAVEGFKRFEPSHVVVCEYDPNYVFYAGCQSYQALHSCDRVGVKVLLTTFGSHVKKQHRNEPDLRGAHDAILNQLVRA